uniref:Uncharacterized protein n=1 Tax=Plectus sambesii TaxID=2011161 RepID=A0A914W3U2_9BILA
MRNLLIVISFVLTDWALCTDAAVKRGGGRAFPAIDDKRGGGRVFQLNDEDKRGGGRAFQLNDNDKRGGGRAFDVMSEKRGGKYLNIYFSIEMRDVSR